MAGTRGVAIASGASPIGVGGRCGHGRRRLWAALTVAAVLCVLGGAAAETLRLEHRTERALEAQVALANTAHQVDAVRFHAYSLLTGPRPLASDYALNDGYRRAAASIAATFAGLSPLGAPVEAAVNQMNGLVEHELQLVAQRQPAAAQSIDNSSVGPLYARLVGLFARDTPILESQAHTAQASGIWSLVGLVVGSGLMLVVVVVTFETSRRRRVRAEAEAEGARVSGERFTAMVEHSSDMITVVGSDTTVSYAAPSIGAVLGRDAAQIEGTALADIVHPDDAQRLRDLCQVGSSDGEELRFRHADGAWLTCEARGTQMATSQPAGAVVLNIRDVTGRKALEDQLRHQAFHDALTGLANRALFTDRVEHAMTREGRHRSGLAVLMIDLDDFKIVNDSLGHGAGDDLLIHVAARLRDCLRSSDTVGRLGGDEFAVLLEDATDTCSAEQAADKVRAALAAPIEVAARPLIVTASIGVATLADDTTSAEDLLRNADAAMYVAKAQGKNRWTPFQPGMHHAVQERVQLKADLIEALAAGDQMELYYQPVITLDAKAVIGVEALLRWNHPTRGLVPPLDFLGFAEESGLILPLGRWVLRQACLQAREWRTDHPETPLSMSVNVSGRQLDDPALVADVARILADTGVDPASLVLEITESVLMREAETTVETLSSLKALGVRLAIDDFGTGYSSLSYLQRFPVDVLKIDRAFTSGLASDPRQASLAEAVITIGANLNLQTVAEGIEIEDQVDKLRALGCAYGQGFLFSRPLPALDCQTLLFASPDLPLARSH